MFTFDRQRAREYATKEIPPPSSGPVDPDVVLARFSVPAQIAELERIRSAPKLSFPSDATSGYFVFDYNAMDTMYGFQAFQAIRESLVLSRGICAFSDGDVSPATLRLLMQQRHVVFDANSNAPLRSASASGEFGPYLAAMWTDNSSNFERVHSWLVGHLVPGYRGCMVLSERHEHLPFVRAAASQLGISVGISFADGRVVPHTSQYGVK